MQDVIHFYKTQDLTKVKAFYESILGLSLYLDQGSCLIYHLNGYGKIGFCLHHPKEMNDSTCITFVYSSKEEVDDMAVSFTSKGLVCTDCKVNPTYHIYHFFLRDNEGRLLEFQTFLEGKR